MSVMYVQCIITVCVWYCVEIFPIFLLIYCTCIIYCSSKFLLLYSENAILEGEDREGIYSFVALSAHYIGLNVTQCRYLSVYSVDFTQSSTIEWIDYNIFIFITSFCYTE